MVAATVLAGDRGSGDLRQSLIQRRGEPNRTAVDDRASKECLRHHGYASAIQNASKPACSQALAMATVSRTGSMLS